MLFYVTLFSLISFGSTANGSDPSSNGTVTVSSDSSTTFHKSNCSLYGYCDEVTTNITTVILTSAASDRQSYLPDDEKETTTPPFQSSESLDPTYMWYFGGFGVLSGVLVGLVVGLFIYMRKRNRCKNRKSDTVELCPVTESKSSGCNDGIVKSPSKHIIGNGSKRVGFHIDNLTDVPQHPHEHKTCASNSSTCSVKVTSENRKQHMLADNDNKVRDIQKPNCTNIDCQGSYDLVDPHPLPKLDLLPTRISEQSRKSNIPSSVVEKPRFYEDTEPTYAKIDKKKVEILTENIEDVENVENVENDIAEVYVNEDFKARNYRKNSKQNDPEAVYVNEDFSDENDRENNIHDDPEAVYVNENFIAEYYRKNNVEEEDPEALYVNEDFIAENYRQNNS